MSRLGAITRLFGPIKDSPTDRHEPNHYRDEDRPLRDGTPRVQVEVTSGRGMRHNDAAVANGESSWCDLVNTWPTSFDRPAPKEYLA